MRTRFTRSWLLWFIIAINGPAVARDWPQWGGDTRRNMVGTETGRPVSFDPGKKKSDSNEIPFGSPIYSTAVAANGILYVSTQTHLYAIQEPPSGR